jgi:hypothetical protein
VKNAYITKSNLQTQRNPHQNPNVILHKNRKIDPKVHMEACIAKASVTERS